MKGERLQMQQIARRWTGAALRVLHRGLRSADERVRIMAAKELLDRGWGRPAQALTGPDGGPLGVVVGMVAGAPITTAEEATAAYLQFIGNPNADISTLRFQPPAPQPIEADEPHMETAQESVEVEPPHDYHPEPAPFMEPEAAPGNVVNFAEWERLGK